MKIPAESFGPWILVSINKKGAAVKKLFLGGQILGIAVSVVTTFTTFAPLGIGFLVAFALTGVIGFANEIWR